MASSARLPKSWAAKALLCVAILDVLSAHAAYTSHETIDHLARRDPALSLQAQEIANPAYGLQQPRLVRRGKKEGSFIEEEKTKESPYKLPNVLASHLSFHDFLQKSHELEKIVQQQLKSPDGESYVGSRATDLYRAWLDLLFVQTRMALELRSGDDKLHDNMEKILQSHEQMGGDQDKMAPHLQEQWDTYQTAGQGRFLDYSQERTRADEILAAANHMVKILHTQGKHDVEKHVKSSEGPSGVWDVWSPSSVRALLRKTQHEHPEAWNEVKDRAHKLHPWMRRQT